MSQSLVDPFFFTATYFVVSEYNDAQIHHSPHWVDARYEFDTLSPNT
jgi:hypothetical protein